MPPSPELRQLSARPPTQEGCALLVLAVHDFGVGGFENALRRLIPRLEALGFAQAVVSVRPLRAHEPVKASSLGRSGGFLLPEFLRAFREMRPDVVHTHNW